jgi:hypothetical protein
VDAEYEGNFSQQHHNFFFVLIGLIHKNIVFHVVVVCSSPALAEREINDFFDG